jgi:hypothetical protein
MFYKKNIIILIRIKEIYVKVPKNRLSVIVIENISVNGKAILSLVIMLSKNIIMSWFSEQITRAEVILVLLSGYINKKMCV